MLQSTLWRFEVPAAIFRTFKTIPPHTRGGGRPNHTRWNIVLKEINQVYALFFSKSTIFSIHDENVFIKKNYFNIFYAAFHSSDQHPPV